MIFNNSWGKKKHFFDLALITPMCQASMVAESWPRAPKLPGPQFSSFPKQGKSDVHVKSQNPVNTRLPMTKSKEKNTIESTAI